MHSLLEGAELNGGFVRFPNCGWIGSHDKISIEESVGCWTEVSHFGVGECDKCFEAVVFVLGFSF